MQAPKWMLETLENLFYSRDLEDDEVYEIASLLENPMTHEEAELLMLRLENKPIMSTVLEPDDDVKWWTRKNM